MCLFYLWVGLVGKGGWEGGWRHKRDVGRE